MEWRLGCVFLQSLLHVCWVVPWSPQEPTKRSRNNSGAFVIRVSIGIPAHLVITQAKTAEQQFCIFSWVSTVLSILYQALETKTGSL